MGPGSAAGTTHSVCSDSASPDHAPA